MFYLEGIRLTRSPVLSGVIFSLSPIMTILLEIIISGERAGAGFYGGSFLLLAGILVVALR